MPCSDSSSSMSLLIDHDEKLISFEFAKITCGQEIKGSKGLKEYFQGQPLEEILQSSFADVERDLAISDDESRFILYLEWEAVHSAVAQYLGNEDEAFDSQRSVIS